MLVSMKKILEDAKEGKYAVAAPNVWNDWTTRAAIDAAEEMNSPLILDYGFNPNVYYWMDYAKLWAKEASVPVAINLDHGETYEQAIKCINSGFTSIMVDRSSRPFDENVSDVAELVKVAHAAGISVEAELGYVGQASEGDEENVSHYTDANLAKKYVDKTNVDCLAVSIGNAHGRYNKGKNPKIRYDIIEAIQEETDIPLVLHGGSGTSHEDFRKLSTETNITKVNLFTDLHDAVLENFTKNDLTKEMIPGWDMENYFVYKDTLKEYMELFNSKNQAKRYSPTVPYKREDKGGYDIK